MFFSKEKSLYTNLPSFCEGRQAAIPMRTTSTFPALVVSNANIFFVLKVPVLFGDVKRSHYLFPSLLVPGLAAAFLILTLSCCPVGFAFAGQWHAKAASPFFFLLLLLF